MTESTSTLTRAVSQVLPLRKPEEKSTEVDGVYTCKATRSGRPSNLAPIFLPFHLVVQAAGSCYLPTWGHFQVDNSVSVKKGAKKENTALRRSALWHPLQI